MDVIAKVTANNEAVTSGKEQQVSGTLFVEPGSQVALNLAPEAVQSYIREGADLVITLQSGETIRIAGFYGDPQKPGKLFLVGEDQELLLADLQPQTDGSFTAAYVPQPGSADFEETGVGGAIVGGGPGIGAILGGVAALGGGVALAGGGGGGNGSGNPPAPPAPPPPPPPADTTAPGPATNLAISAAGTLLTGSAEPGATAGIDTNGDGVIDRTATVGANGQFQIALDPPLTNGETVTVFVTDPAGNRSGPASVAAPDTTAPDPARNLVIADDGTMLTGTAEPNATVRADTNGDGIADVTVTASGDGTFTIPLDPPLTDGEVVAVIVVDMAGNQSGPALTVAPDLVPTPPAPAIDPTNGTIITGMAEAGATVRVTDGSGALVGTAVAGADGRWSVTPVTPLADGTRVIAVAVNSEGDAGPAATAIVDAVAPAAPVIAPTNGEELTGTAEAGTTIIVRDGNGNVIGTDIADANGAWSVTPPTPLPDGAAVSATATDAAGNVSPPANAIVDASLPDIPSIAPTNGTVIEGTADAGDTIYLTDGAGNAIGTAIADANGAWSFTPQTPLPDGTIVRAVAEDASGSRSGPATAIVDALAPPPPVIDPTNGSEVSGTAEAGALVTLTDGAGAVIGQADADGNGNWSVTPNPALADGATVTATATDAAGNVSGPATAIVDAVAPAAPMLSPTNGAEISGTAEAGALVRLTDNAGNAIGTVQADANGNFDFTPATPLPDGTIVTATATDAAGNVSPPASVTVDASLPSIPDLEPSNGTVIEGMADAGNLIILTDGAGNPIGQTVAGANGAFSFTPQAPLADGTIVRAVAQNAAGSESGPATLVIDAVAPPVPTVEPTNGTEVSGMAEAGAIVTLTDGGGNVIGYTQAADDGSWTFTPGQPLGDGTIVRATATDAAGNVSGPGMATVDAAAPAAPGNLAVNAEGSVLTGTAEAGSLVTVVVDGDTANPITVQADANGTFSVSFSPPLVEGEVLTVTATDAVGNVSAPGTALAPDLTPPALTVAEAADGYLNGAELADGIQVEVAVEPGVRAGDVINVTFTGQNGYELTLAHVVTEADRAAGSVVVTLDPPSGMADFPEGAAAITAAINGGDPSAPVNAVVDTIPPATPVLSLVGNVLNISAEPGTTLEVLVQIAGTTARVAVTADNNGLASIDLLADLDIGLTLDQLLDATVSVTGSDVAGNDSNVATLAIGPSLPPPITIGDLELDVGLLPPVLGISGTAENGMSVRVEVITPLASAFITPAVDANGNFSINLLSPSLLSQLGLSITDILNLGSGLSLNIVATDQYGNDSASYGISFTGSGLTLAIGDIVVTGTSGNDMLAGTDGQSETILAGDGADLILNVGTGDDVDAGGGDDAIMINAANFASIDGGDGFDTLIIDGGIDLDYNGPGVGTLSNIERIDLGRGDDGSILTLTAAEVEAVTDGDNILQITGEANDTLNVQGAVATGTTQTIEGITYDVYTFGNATLLVEDNSVQVVTA